MKKVATITIGQSPRIDLIPEISKYLNQEIQLIEYGILDSYSYEEAQSLLKPNIGDNVLVSRMRDGRQVKMREKLVFELVQNCINKIEKSDIKTILLLCTGKFPKFNHKGIFIEPFSLIHSVVSNVIDGKIGVIVPDESQIFQSRKYWRQTGNEVSIRAASPYKNFDSEFKKSALYFKQLNVPLIVLDCMGYSIAMKEKVEKTTGKSVLLPRIFISKLLEELV